MWTDVLSVRVLAGLNISVYPSAPRLGNQRPWYMYSRVYATGHIKDPVPLIEKRRGLSPGGRFPPSFIHQVMIITGLNKFYNRMFSPWRWPQMPTGHKTPTRTQAQTVARTNFRFLESSCVIQAFMKNLWSIIMFSPWRWPQLPTWR